MTEPMAKNKMSLTYLPILVPIERTDLAAGFTGPGADRQCVLDGKVQGEARHFPHDPNHQNHPGAAAR